MKMKKKMKENLPVTYVLPIDGNLLMIPVSNDVF